MDCSYGQTTVQSVKEVKDAYNYLDFSNKPFYKRQKKNFSNGKRFFQGLKNYADAELIGAYNNYHGAACNDIVYGINKNRFR